MQPESHTMPTAAHQSTTVRRQKLPAALLYACLSIGLLIATVEAQATQEKKDSINSRQTTSGKKGNVRIKYFSSPSEESASQRERRLYRECKGRPDAGACLGYTRR